MRRTTSGTRLGASRTRELAKVGCGVYLGDTDFQRRRDRFVSDRAYRRLGEVRATWDPDGGFCSYLGRRVRIPQPARVRAGGERAPV